jgi:multidrug efflux pump subunit AcrB
VTGPDPAILRELGDSLRTLLAEVPHVIHTAADLSETVPQLALAVDEESARLVGLDNAAISRQLYSTLEGAVGGSVLEGTEELPVRVRVSDTARADLQNITSLDLIAAGGVASAAKHSPVRALAEVSLVSAPALIAHRNGSRVNTGSSSA